MRTEIRSAISLRGPDHKVFGTTCWIDGDVIRFETHGAASIGDRGHIRLELAGSCDSVQATVRLVDVHPGPPGDPLHCTAVIEGIDDADRVSLDQWVEEVSISRSLDSQTSAGRARVTRALLASLQRPRSPAHPTWEFEADPGLRVPGGTRAELHLSADQRQLSVRWRHARDLLRDWETLLCEGRVEGISDGPPPPEGTVLSLVFRLPCGLGLTARGVAEAPVGLRTRVRFQLTAALRHHLGQAASAS